MLNVLVADDEKLARQTVKLLLKEHADIINIYEAKDGIEALSIAEQYNPNVAILDIQMPGKTGIEVASQLPKGIAVIFSTAYDKYAIKAFDINAVDYLLKPYDDARFSQAINKVREDLINKKEIDYSLISDYISIVSQQTEKDYQEKLIVKDTGRIRIVETQDINYILGAGNYADIYLNDGSHILHRETLSALEASLDPNLFSRIHRSTIVNKTNIKELSTQDNGDYQVTLKSGDVLTLSRRNKIKLKELLK
ncbi:LytR/AlgR family response regulator transcription factor [Thalassotalea ganghwensis]